jgi:hypothetical protein
MSLLLGWNIPDGARARLDRGQIPERNLLQGHDQRGTFQDNATVRALVFAVPQHG